MVFQLNANIRLSLHRHSLKSESGMYSIRCDDLDCAKKGRFNPYLQGMMQRECSGMELFSEEQAQVRRIQVVLQNVPQWSDGEAVQAEMAEQGGQVLFCKFFKEHSSFAMLTQDRNGLYSIAFVLDCDISPKERKAAARLVRRLLKESSKSWDVDFYTVPVPERMKYASLSLAASALMQAFNHPEKIKG